MREGVDGSASGHTVIVGAGPAGLTAAWELHRLGLSATVLEQDDQVGGISRTVLYRGYRFDIGGHRFFTKVPLVQRLWEEILGEELLERPRLSRIYYGGKFFDYPLKPLPALRRLGLIESVRIAASYARARLVPSPEERNFEQWVTNRFGRRLYEIFFRTYTEKVWGIPCTEIDAEWAAQRIKNLDLLAALKNALLGAGAHRGEVVTTLIDRFHYPRLGPGQMWERLCRMLEERGVETVLGARVVSLRHEGGRVRAAKVRHRDGREETVTGERFISSMPVRNLVEALDPPPPAAVLDAVRTLRYRDFLTVVLIVDREDLFPDNWLYVHSPEVRLGRVQNFKNWSPDMVADPATSSLGLEYFVQEGDELWSAPDEDLIALGTREAAAIGLIEAGEVIDGTVVRMPKAYPVYDGRYREALAVARGHLEGLVNLQLIGRNGQHRYNNQDHSMLTGVYAARNVAGADHDVWSVNVEQQYHEAGEVGEATDRRLPRRIPVDRMEELMRSVFARFDPVALGGAVAVVAAGGLFLATVYLLVRGGEPVGPNLSLLGQYLFGYEVSWRGALTGVAEASLGGYFLGNGLARAINRLTGWAAASLLRRIELERALEIAGGEEP